MKSTRFCPAKVNLFLEVNGKRPNGYHELSTLFAKISLGDMLTVQVTHAPKTSISLQITGPQRAHIPCTSQNLVCKAAQKFLDHYCLHAHIQLILDKHIPTGAGLGGGSSDAAGVLLALCEMFHKDPMELIDLASTLGADVPLFLYPDTFLKGEGIGEKLTPVYATDPLPALVLVYPNVAVSTKEVFARMQIPTEQQVLTNLSKLDKLINVVGNGLPLDSWKPLLFNRLEQYVLPFVPAVQHTIDVLRSTGNHICMMSGSGSTVFNLVSTIQNAQELAEKLQQLKALVFPVTFYKGTGHANYRSKSSFNE